MSDHEESFVILRTEEGDFAAFEQTEFRNSCTLFNHSLNVSANVAKGTSLGIVTSKSREAPVVLNPEDYVLKSPLAKQQQQLTPSNAEVNNTALRSVNKNLAAGFIMGEISSDEVKVRL